jgi:hypothetical protein
MSMVVDDVVDDVVDESVDESVDEPLRSGDNPTWSVDSLCMTKES